MYRSEEGMRMILLTLVATTTACATEGTSRGDTISVDPKDASGATARVVSKDGSQIGFTRVGNGPALVIVSGALAHRALNGDTALVRKLADHFSVYTYDRRGRGESSDTKPYAVDREIEDLEALIDHAGGKAYVYGVSSGAALALQAAAKLGAAKVSKLAVYEPPYGQPQRDFTAQKEGVKERVRTGQPGDAAAFFLSAIGTPSNVLEGMKSSPDWEAIKRFDFTLAYDFDVLGDGRVPEDIVKAIGIPTLVMAGEKSMDFMHPTATRIASLIPDAQRTTLKGQTHQVAAEAVAPVLIEFLGNGRDQ
jgi:pimeloyl-ACP methyl ester carboxylesterase